MVAKFCPHYWVDPSRLENLDPQPQNVLLSYFSSVYKIDLRVLMLAYAFHVLILNVYPLLNADLEK